MFAFFRCMKKLLCLGICFMCLMSSAQTLPELIQIASDNYPSIRSKRAQVSSAQQEVSYQKSDLLPSLSVSYQANIGTANNITGLFLPGNILPISGPPAIENSSNLATGSAAALLLQWNPFTFGKRSSSIAKAENAVQLAQAEEELEVFYHQIQFVETYLDFWESEALYEVLTKETERSEYNFKLAQQMVEDGLRSGMESAQLKSLMVKAKLQALNAKHLNAKKRAEAQELLGGDVSIVQVDHRLHLINKDVKRSTSSEHPLANFSSQLTQVEEAEKKVIQKNILPDFRIWGTTFGRGSSIDANSQFNSYSDGFDFNRTNFGVGFELSFPLLEFIRNKHLVKAQEFQVEASVAYDEQVQLQLTKEEKIAQVTLENAIEAMELAPDYFEAAELSHEVTQSRFKSGLANISELLQAQVEVLEAEKQLVSAKVEFWKAVLYYSATKGNISLFTELIN